MFCAILRLVTFNGRFFTFPEQLMSPAGYRQNNGRTSERSHNNRPERCFDDVEIEHDGNSWRDKKERHVFHKMIG